MGWLQRWQSRSPGAAEALRRGVAGVSDFITGELGSSEHHDAIPPDVAIQSLFRWHRAGQFPIGQSLARGTVAFTEREQHLLAVAPPRSYAGKTSSIIIPHILAHPGPVVVVTTKPDVLPATAMARAQAGKLWCYCPDGVTDRIPAGAEELRWSPIQGAREWDVAIRTARTMAQVVDKESMRHGSHWQSRAADLFAPIFHWAVASGRTMRDARDAVYTHASSLVPIERWLRDNGAPGAAAMLRSVIAAAAEERASIGSTASAALAAYSTEAAMRTTDVENFDIADFINGGDGCVRADTIYINPMTRDQRELAPLIVGLLSQIQDAAYERHRNLVRNGLTGHPGAGPILFALDELYGLAPMPDLPHLLSEGGSQGIHVTAAVQDLTLVKSRWPKEAASFMTLFGHVLFFPGIRDDATLKQISGLLGHHDVEKRSETVKNTQTGGGIKGYFAGREPQWTERVENVTYSTERRPRYDIDEVQTGPVPEDPDCAFHFYPGGWWEIVRLDPYYRGQTWPAAITAFFERALSGHVPEWQWWESYHSSSHARPDIRDTLPALPVPPLHQWAQDAARYGTPGPDGAWARRFAELIRIREEILAHGPRQARWGIHEPNAKTWLVTHPDARLARSRDGAAPQPERPPASPAAAAA